MVAFTVILTYVGVALLDSLHFRKALENPEGLATEEVPPDRLTPRYIIERAKAQTITKYRMKLESGARLAAVAATDSEIRELRKHALRHSESSSRADLSEYSEANIRFHQMILEMSGCRLLAAMADELFVHMHGVRRRALEENNRATRSVVDHLEIIEALEARDGDLAARLVREHTMRLHNHVRDAWTKFEQRAEATG